MKKEKKKPKNGDKKKFFGIWFTYRNGIWSNDFINKIVFWHDET
jgi:hypothetical protein